MQNTPGCFGIPSKGSAVSEIFITGATTTGSTNTRIRVFTTVAYKSGSAVTYYPSATNGDSFLVNESGMYFLSYVDVLSATVNGAYGITKNVTATEASASVNAVAFTRVIAAVDCPSVVSTGCSAITYLYAGDRIYPHVNLAAGSTGSISDSNFRIIKLF